MRLLEPDLIGSVVQQAQALYGSVGTSLTGGEPLIHPEFSRIIAILAERRVPYRLVTNGWHLARALPALEQYPPQAVRLSLSGADEATHDAERGRGSFRRVLLGIALLTSRRIPAYLSIVVDQRDRTQLREAADLAEDLGCAGLGYILPQPTKGSAERASDLAPGAWLALRREIAALAAEPGRRTEIAMDYGFPFESHEEPCATFALQRMYVDTRGRLCTCCQLSNYGGNEAEVVADLHTTSLAEAHRTYVQRLRALAAQQRPDPSRPRVTDPFPCLRCAKSSGKLEWLDAYSRSAWYRASDTPRLAKAR
jgi:MoaA/NifB/PqqE/SkfB family radical SAM enzyme